MDRCIHVPMNGGQHDGLRPDVRQLAPAVNFFLKQIRTRFTVESCAEALVLTLVQFIQFKYFLGYLWESDRQADHRFKITLSQGTVCSQPK